MSHLPGQLQTAVSQEVFLLQGPTPPTAFLSFFPSKETIYTIICIHAPPRALRDYRLCISSQFSMLIYRSAKGVCAVSLFEG